MDFVLTAEQELMRDSMRRMVARAVEPLLAQHPAERSLPKPAFMGVLAHLAELGLTAARLPEALGGSAVWSSAVGTHLAVRVPVAAGEHA